MASAHRTCQLGQPHQPRRRLGVAQVALDTPDDQHTQHISRRKQRSSDGTHLDRVAQRGAVCRRLHLLQLRRRRRRVAEHRVQQLLLRPPVGRRQARASPVLTHRAPHDRRRDWCGLQHARAAALAPHKPACSRIKHQRLARRRRQPRRGVAHKRRRHEHHVDARNQRVARLAQLQRPLRAVARHQRRRARDVDRLTRAVQPQHVRQPPASEAVAGARHGVRVAVRQHLPELRRHHAHVHCRAALQELTPQQPAAVQRPVPHLEQQPLLRIHRARLCQRNAEQRVVKQLDAAQERAVPSGAHSALRERAPKLAFPSGSRASTERVAPRCAQPPRGRQPSSASRKHRIHTQDAHAALHDRPPPAARRHSRRSRSLSRKEPAQTTRCRVIEHERARQHRALARRHLQLVAQLDRAQRVDTRLHQRRIRVHVAARRPPHHLEHRLKTHHARRRPRFAACSLLAHTRRRTTTPQVRVRRHEAPHLAAARKQLRPVGGQHRKAAARW